MSKLSKFLILIATYLICISAYIYNHKNFNPKTADYCKPKIQCHNISSTGCRCRKSKWRKEVQLEKIVSFRNVCVHEHNRLRNRVAAGKATESHFDSTAADMMIINYDLELEFLARCYGRSRYDAGHDGCRIMSQNAKNRYAVQNFAGRPDRNFTNEEVIRVIRDVWYNEVKKFRSKDWIDDGTKVYIVEHAVEAGYMLWSRTSAIGCARIWTRNTKFGKYLDLTYRNSIICNYAVLILMDNKDEFPLKLKQTMVKKGKPCSACPEKLKCNKVYTSLCGNLEPIPTELYSFQGGGIVAAS